MSGRWDRIVAERGRSHAQRPEALPEGGSLHFITFSCFHRLALLEAPAAREMVEAVLERTRARHQARVYAYVLMPEHVHLLVNEPPRIVLAQFLKAVKQITSRRLRGARAKFWQDRYYDSNVRGEKARSEVIRYIHRNPVERGLVAKPDEWPWSSFRHYATGVTGAVEIESQWTVARRGNQLPEGVRLKKANHRDFPPKPQTTRLGWGTIHRGEPPVSEPGRPPACGVTSVAVR
jgi:putative transposase